MNTNTKPSRAPRKDTGAWIMLSWLGFLTAVGVSFFGILSTPGEIWVKGYLLMGLCFLLSATFTLSKTLRDNQFGRVDTSQWIMQVWIGFLLASGLALLGVINVPGDGIHRAFALMSLLFSVTASFTLAKTIRDNHEATAFEQADANGDGTLSRAEATGSTFASRFTRADKNADGSLDQSEALGR